jgi:hypothetical protein
LLNWLKNKEDNGWVLKCLSIATSEMSRDDWFATSFTTNIAEAAHAHSQREGGLRGSLVSAIKKGLTLDKRLWQTATAVQETGIQDKYGNNSMSGKAFKNLTRGESTKRKKDERNSELQAQKEVLDGATNMIRLGIPLRVIANYIRVEAEIAGAEKQVNKES